MAPPSFQSSLSITHIHTAAAILELDGINLITDPFFTPGGAEWDLGIAVLKNSDTPALGLQDIPVIDAVLLSHEDHIDNLDELGRQLLNGRRVLTTEDGAKKLAPRPGVRGLKPWQTVALVIGKKRFEVTATPCQHLPGGECIGFILTASEFGETNGLPNAIYYSGDTVYLEELKEMTKRFHISVALLNAGAALVPIQDPPLQITMDGKQAAKLFREIKADLLVPMHFESWNHFSQKGQELAKDFESEGIQEHVCWLTPGVSKKIV
jgi:L-ascorbate metabolism protein UlaG (beta-lactamase superfamily)